MYTTFTTLLSNFIVGAAAIPPILLVWYFFSYDSNWQQLLVDLKSVFEFLNTYSKAAWLFTGAISIVCIIVGIIFDLIGHKMIDEIIFKVNREKLVPAVEREVIIKSTPDGSVLRFDTILQSYFYTHAPAHLLQYHGEQWAFCEFCRNAAVVSFLYLISGFAIFIKFNQWVKMLVWVVIWSAVTSLITLTLKFAVSYYYRIETVFTIGWLLEKHLLEGSSHIIKAED